jgi:hypothetical protein
MRDLQDHAQYGLKYASAAALDQTRPDFPEHRKPKKFESAINLQQLKGWPIGSGLRWSVCPAHPALDVIMNRNPNTQAKFLAGGSCGNVLVIFSFLGWKSYPIARLSDKPSAKLLFEDLQKHNVNLD